MERRPPIRLLTLTTLFPNGSQPRHGIFVANRLRRLCDTGRIQASVIAAVPWFPGAYRIGAGIPRAENVAGFDVRHPRYVKVPGIGMRIQPDSLARALLEELRRSGMEATGFDAIDAHYFYPDGVAAARVAEELGLPLVISARGSDINLIGDIPFARQRMLRAAHRAQALIAVSGALARRMTELGMPAERVHVLRNGVDTEMFAPFSRAEARSRLGLRDGVPWVLGVGNLSRRRGSIS
jgi:glycosyltransferase involved in cell wall biosynthesis